MSPRSMVTIVVLASSLSACAGEGLDTPLPNEDQGPPFDWTTTLADVPGAACANGILEPGEACAANWGPNDCVECRWESFCGDGRVAGEETCDDGNTWNDDTCRANCERPECGDGYVDVGAGEVCDDAECPGCASPTCGDGDVDEGEHCDDGNRVEHDGCGLGCREERPFLVRTFDFVSYALEDCVLPGHRVPTNAIGYAFGTLQNVVNQQVETTLESAPAALVFSDWSAPAPSRPVRMGVVGVTLVDAVRREIRVTLPTDTSTFVRFADGSFRSETSDLTLPIGLSPRVSLPLADVTFFGSVEPSPERVDRLVGHVCAATTIREWAQSADVLPSGGRPACGDIGSRRISILDAIAGGRNLGVLATQPDVDLDGDGLERILVAGDPSDACTPVAVGCVEGDGTRIDDPLCVLDLDDGYSMVVQLTAERVSFAPP